MMSLLIPDGFVRIKDAVMSQAIDVTTAQKIDLWDNTAIGECPQNIIDCVSGYFRCDLFEYAPARTRPYVFALRSNDIAVPADMKIRRVVVELLQTQVRLRLYHNKIPVLGL